MDLIDRYALQDQNRSFNVHVMQKQVVYLCMDVKVKFRESLATMPQAD
jgi:hypothetical protein